MATMKCPHCGKEIYDGLLECPNCHGPIEHNCEAAIDEIFEELNNSEKKLFKWSCILGIIGGFFGGIGYGIALDMGIGAVIFLAIMFLINAPIAIYGILKVFRALKDSPLLVILPFGTGWAIALALALSAGVFVGFVAFPKAIIKLKKNEPLVSREKIIKQLS